MDVPSLLGLPPELSICILEAVPCSDHLNFALLCKTIHRLFKDTLAYHRKCHEEYASSSDLLPLTIPNLVRKVFSDPIASWHIRDLEFWRLRPDWDSWKSTDSVLVDASGLGKSGKFYSKAELAAFRAALTLFTKPPQEEDWMQRLLEGDEEPLRLILIALAPRLRSLKFALCGESNESSHPLNLLTHAVANFLKSSGCTPSSATPGFYSLRSVAVGIDTSLAYDGERYRYNWPSITGLFNLPNIESLYFEALTPTPNQTGQINVCPIAIRRGSSAVRHIYLENPILDVVDMEELIRFPEALKSFTLSHGRSGCKVLDMLRECHAKTLENLDIWKSDNISRFHRQYFSAHAMKGLQPFVNLRHIVLDPQVIYYPHLPLGHLRAGRTHGPLHGMNKITLASIIPSSVHAITFRMDCSSPYLNSIVLALDKLVQNAICSGELCNLRAIFLQSIELVETFAHTHGRAGYYLRDGSGSGEMPLFRNAVAVGKKHGVDVYTHWSHTAEQAWQRMDELGIPRPVTEADLKTDVRKDVAGFTRKAERARMEVKELLDNQK